MAYVCVSMVVDKNERALRSIARTIVKDLQLRRLWPLVALSFSFSLLLVIVIVCFFRLTFAVVCFRGIKHFFCVCTFPHFHTHIPTELKIKETKTATTIELACAVGSYMYSMKLALLDEK